MLALDSCVQPIRASSCAPFPQALVHACVARAGVGQGRAFLSILTVSCFFQQGESGITSFKKAISFGLYQVPCSCTYFA